MSRQCAESMQKYAYPARVRAHVLDLAAHFPRDCNMTPAPERLPPLRSRCLLRHPIGNGADATSASHIPPVHVSPKETP
jgi:hypothetical protein